MFDDDDINPDEGKVLDAAEQLKYNLCKEVDLVARTLVEQSQAERKYTEDVERLQAILGRQWNPSLPVHERVLLVLKRNRELEDQAKKTDELLLAKRHYLPLIQHILQCSQDRGDQAMVNTVNEFLISGRLI